ncbi:hypothetical protein QCN29_30815 [Streptomyces sp. HNM0663]|uniref:Uncharacterized protein n=1 Tax=Streptomyces chengmaiensis TaxID=3040919 RepID=A0ABT6HXR4_9ACTN|nr:hypothetical protein [Streptomyces chengmaiensis]MDH2393092.1 hypothetical protein [Streptomyces chengmaiensis]
MGRKRVDPAGGDGQPQGRMPLGSVRGDFGSSAMSEAGIAVVDLPP